jgi:folylpolyglutamate synthase/dihydropteroate synthase
MGGTAVSFTSVKEAVKDALSKCRDDEAIVSFGSLGNAGEIRKVVLSQVTE